MTESAKELSFGMDTKSKFQLQPSSCMETLEMLIGTGLDRVYTTNLLSGTESAGSEAHSTRMPNGSEILLVIGGGPRCPPVGSQFECTVLETSEND